MRQRNQLHHYPSRDETGLQEGCLAATIDGSRPLCIRAWPFFTLGKLRNWRCSVQVLALLAIVPLLLLLRPQLTVNYISSKSWLGQGQLWAYPKMAQSTAKTEEHSSSDQLVEQNVNSSQILLNFRIMTMNIAEMEPSRSAPRNFTRKEQQQLLWQELLRTNPDILCLQECPDGQWWHKDPFAGWLSDYEHVTSRASHAGSTTIWVKRGIGLIPMPAKRLSAHTPAAMTIFAAVAPAAVQPPTSHGNPEVVASPPRPVLAVASVHLEPFDSGSDRRQRQVQNIIQAAMGVPLIIAGDTNIRDNEDLVMEQTLSLQDVWKQAGRDEQLRYTWDTMDHRATGGTFNKYYGASTRQYQRRYDRIYVHGAKHHWTVPSLELLAHRPIGSSRLHFLSDHFGMAAHLELTLDS